MMAIKKSVRLVDDTIDACAIITRDPEINYSGAINQITERYSIFVQDCLPELKIGEKHALCQAYNGRINNYNLSEELRIMSFNISEAINYDGNVRDLLDAENIDHNEFHAKVSNWSPSQKIAVLAMIESFWTPKFKDIPLKSERI
jgi:hypothetical protein